MADRVDPLIEFDKSPLSTVEGICLVREAEYFLSDIARQDSVPKYQKVAEFIGACVQRTIFRRHFGDTNNI